MCQETEKRPRIRRESAHRSKGGHRSKKPFKSADSLLLRSAICALLLGVVAFIVYGDLPVTNRMKSGLVSALTFEVDVDKSLGKLKFVQSNDSTVQSVMSHSADLPMELPVKNAVAVSSYSEGNKSMVFEATELTDVVSPAAGIVENVDSENYFAVTIDHGNDVKSVLSFNGAMAVLEEGSVLKKGDYVGLVDKGATVTFTVIKNGHNVNPSGFLTAQ